MADCGCGSISAKHAAQRKTLWVLLAINAGMFGLEAVTGWWAQSTALLADSLDMLADAAVYGVSLYAVRRSASAQALAARLSGGLQIALALLVLLDGVRRFTLGREPEPGWMVAIGLVALVANVACLVLLARHRKEEVHMRASWIFSKNDVIANLGTIAAGFLVSLTRSPWPDLVVGWLIGAIVLHGGVSILRAARQQTRDDSGAA
ncbi:cation diffusion facilitator family transporter [Nodosilinea sp. E11]|uniref:cation diffusion facilitator family transporter n=1 Tax=Nodosilinea sp. E11 TaxID=3037479 RepID=UPI0029348C89|nr:cation diffusion facilitator family transporter [Nodosilinea sp. E11]WOD41023.1 cation diffusion facilitator family transporter [Nodosilinea sp. E11]